jgi:hypothetical protein
MLPSVTITLATAGFKAMAAKKGPDKKLVNLAFRIKPLVADAQGEPHFIAPLDIYREEIGDDARLLQKADLKEAGEVRVELPAGLRSFFGPTVAQALSEIPKEKLRGITAFTISIDPGMYSGEEGYVNATCRLYQGRLPEEIKTQPVIAMGQRFEPPAPRKRFEKAASVETMAEVSLLKPLVLRKPPPGPAQG